MLSLRKVIGWVDIRKNFIAVAHNHVNPVVVEEPDTLGYTMTRPFKGASKQTKAALLEIMPASEWEQMKENAWDGYILEGSYYRKDAV